MKEQRTQDSNRSSTTPYRVDTRAEETYWRSAYEKEPYYNKSYGYDDYSPAYQLGYESRSRYMGRSYDEVEGDLSADWDRTKGKSKLMWNDAKNAVRAAWHRVERAMPGDADNDRR